MKKLRKRLRNFGFKIKIHSRVKLCFKLVNRPCMFLTPSKHCCIGGAWRTVTLFIECHMASIRKILNS